MLLLLAASFDDKNAAAALTCPSSPFSLPAAVLPPLYLFVFTIIHFSMVVVVLHETEVALLGAHHADAASCFFSWAQAHRRLKYRQASSSATKYEQTSLLLLIRQPHQHTII
jgi:hypothetical protein